MRGFSVKLTTVQQRGQNHQSVAIVISSSSISSAMAKNIPSVWWTEQRNWSGEGYGPKEINIEKSSSCHTRTLLDSVELFKTLSWSRASDYTRNSLILYWVYCFYLVWNQIEYITKPVDNVSKSHFSPKSKKYEFIYCLSWKWSLFFVALTSLS